MGLQGLRVGIIGVAMLTVLAVPAAAGGADAGADVGVEGCEAPDAADTLEGGPTLATAHDTDPSSVACSGIRPGGALVQRLGPVENVYCSIAFLFTNGTHTVAATAGHCVGEESLVQVHGVPGYAGEVVFRMCGGSSSATSGCQVGQDFALIEIYPEKTGYVDPAMCTWGAPDGGVQESPTTFRLGQHFGWGIGFGQAGATVNHEIAGVGNPATQARAGPVTYTDDGFVHVASAASPGDSGSPLMTRNMPTDGSVHGEQTALGVITHISVGNNVIAQRLDAGITNAEDELGTDFTLLGAS